MKVRLPKQGNSYIGKSENAVYYYHPRLQMCLARRYVVPKNEKNTERTKAIMANLKQIEPSDEYKRDFQDYWIAYNMQPEQSEKQALSWYNLYIKMMFAMQKKVPGVNLATLTREQIYAENLPCKTVYAAIEAGLLPPVPNYQRLKKPI
ncbi:MAG TPA: hypothetical protein PLF50_01045 [Candidatus Cloacimonadota bacterium]|nr:hypothetical protein [Candidatus Cloacimonadota bacterium]HOV16078.1 hypothetical protein [Candidatus Cloacimonadota bacterium]HQL14826.1 hypothetical protein [Candidatus Cloacimonadota bacterium]